MPKMKSHRGAAKRFKVTASGKIKRQQAGKSHLLAKKTEIEREGLENLLLWIKWKKKSAKVTYPCLKE